MWPFPNSSSGLLVDTSTPQIGAHRPDDLSGESFNDELTSHQSALSGT